MIYRFIYKVKCLCGDWKGKYYIGQHTTNDLNDGYAGSGVKILEYYSIYGKKLNETYTIKILRSGAKNQQQLDSWEINYIKQYLGRDKCLNIDEGGLHRKINKLDFHTVELLEDGTYRNCDEINIETEYPKYDQTTNIILYQLKQDPYNFELRKKAINRLLKYNTTPAILGIL